jgi:hypothetical protein
LPDPAWFFSVNLQNGVYVVMAQNGEEVWMEMVFIKKRKATPRILSNSIQMLNAENYFHERFMVWLPNHYRKSN